MKKSRLRLLKYVFWFFVVLVVLWIMFAPPEKTHHRTPHQVDVVKVPESTVTPPSTGDEQSQGVLPPVVILPTESSVKLPSLTRGQSKIAIVIDDVGLDMAGSHRAVALPSFVTLSYIPYSLRLHEQTRAAIDAGHELLLHMPMEPVGSADPGPNALLLELSKDELRQRLDTALASFTGYDGMNNHMGSKFTADADAMELVINELQQRHVFFLDSRTSAQSVGARIAHEHGVPSISRDIFLDDDMSSKAVRNQLEQTERVARHKGYAVAIGHPHAVTLQTLEEWIPDAQRRGFEFVPIKNLVNQP